MPPNAFLYAAPVGVLGDVSRAGESNVEPIFQGSQFPAYGQPVKYNGSGQAIPFAGAETKADFRAILVRQAPAISGNTNQGFGDGLPWLQAVQGQLTRGYCVVKCTVGTPVRGGVVYIVINVAGGGVIGDFRSTADGGNTIALDLSQAQWATNGKDSDSLAEIRLLA